MSNFDVHGTKILFSGHQIGFLGGAPWVGLELDAVAALLDYQDPTYMVTDEEHQKALDECEKENYDFGHKDGVEAGRAACEAEKRSEWEEDAFAEGRDSALGDAERAAQVHRVDALLQAVAKAHDALLATVGKRFPAATVKECKDTMRRVQSDLRAAHAAYNAPNGA
ncbi:MAG: hypothetical protein WC829_01030 [Hyphomicrobium sp.]|jgi:hypothetical protein